MRNAKSGAANFIRYFITEVDSKGFTRLKGLCGNYFELILEDYLKGGRFQNYRILSEPGAAVEVPQGTDNLHLFEKCDHVRQRSFVSIPTALLAYGTPDEDRHLFSFCKSHPAVDFATAGFSVCFQATTVESHTINFNGISGVCEHVRRRFGESASAQLVFVVPDEKVFSKWRYTQSFTYTEATAEVVLGGEEIIAKRKRQSKYAQLSPEMQLKVSNLKQMYVYEKSGA